MAAPLIGIGCDVLPPAGDEERERVYIWTSYTDAVARSDGTPLLIPVRAADLSTVVDTLDGLILAGGDDLSPDSFDDEPRGCSDLVDPRRQQNDLELARFSRQRYVPLLGICLGAQVIAVSAGGSLVQDIPSEIADPLDHGGKKRTRHEVVLEAESILSSILGGTKIEVNSGHHQSVREPGDGLRIVGRAADGVVEAIEDPRHPFCVGVQWHPEETLDEESTRRLFAAFIGAARRRRRARTS